MTHSDQPSGIGPLIWEMLTGALLPRFCGKWKTCADEPGQGERFSSEALLSEAIQQLYLGEPIGGVSKRLKLETLWLGVKRVWPPLSPPSALDGGIGEMKGGESCFATSSKALLSPSESLR